MKVRLRQPLFWIVAAEVVVMFVLLAVSWRVYLAHRPASSASPPMVAAAPAGTAAPRAPASPAPGTSASPAISKPAARPLPSGFPVNLGRLNAEQGSLERLEEDLLGRLTNAMRAYVETVVLPEVRRAERESAAITPARAQSAAAIRKMP